MPEARKLDGFDNEMAFDCIRRRRDWAWRVKDIKAPANINAEITAVRALAAPGMVSFARLLLLGRAPVEDCLPDASGGQILTTCEFLDKIFRLSRKNAVKGESLELG